MLLATSLSVSLLIELILYHKIYCTQSFINRIDYYVYGLSECICLSSPVRLKLIVFLIIYLVSLKLGDMHKSLNGIWKLHIETPFCDPTDDSFIFIADTF